MEDFPLQCLIPGLYPGKKRKGKCGKPMGKTAWNMIYKWRFLHIYDSSQEGNLKPKRTQISQKQQVLKGLQIYS